MDLLATPTRRKALFGLLYLSEGAPIGFIWLGLPTRMRALDVPLDQITWLMALLILPWTLKFLWAPLVDWLTGPRWGFKHWIMASQTIMALTLVPLWFLDLRTNFSLIAVWLFMHAVSAATQDIGIDALCIRQSTAEERGSLNGWMQCGVLVGRALMGGGSLMLERWIGFGGVIAMLIGLVFFSILLLARCRETPSQTNAADEDSLEPQRSAFQLMIGLLRQRKMWIGLGFALTAPAAFKALEAVVGPFLVDRGYSEFSIGRFTSTAMIGGMIAGSLVAGRLSRLIRATRLVALTLVMNLLAIAGLAATDLWFSRSESAALMVALTIVAVTIGGFTVAMYNWLMNLTDPRLAATQFTAFMAMTNACEAWSTATMGQLQARWGYPEAMLTLCFVSAIAATLLLSQRLPAFPQTESITT